MADRHIHNDGRSVTLPPLQSLLNRMYQCRHPGCHQAFDHLEKQFRHEQVCEAANQPSFASLEVHYRDGGRMPSMNTHALPIRPSFEAPSPPSAMSDNTDSDDSSCAYTPGSSRANSVSLPTDRRNSGVQRTTTRYAREARNPSPREGHTTQQKAKKKQEKEKQNRSNQAAVLWRVEDFLRNYCGWERKEQSNGNGNGAGLSANKINLLRGEEALSYHFLHKARCQALAEGTVAAFEAECRAILDEAADEGEGAAPYRGTFLFGEQDVPCKRQGKMCVVHGQPDWRECRKVQMERRFWMNEQAFVREVRRGA